MAKNSKIFLIVLVFIPVAIHFFLLNKFLVNFPSWGDDIIYLDIIEKFDKMSWPERLAYIFAFHNHIHRLAFSRALLILIYKILGVIDFKAIIMVANLQWIVILWVIFKYLKREQLSIWYLVGISIFLFSVNGNIDNYGLIGVLQHLTSILFLVLISYGLIYKPNHFWPLFLSLLYPFVITEGLAFILIVVTFLYLIKSKFSVVFSILGVALFVFYFHDYVGDHSNISNINTLEKVYLFVKGMLVFLGSSIKHHISLAWIIGIFMMVYGVRFSWKAVSEKLSSKPTSRIFPLLLFGQTVMIGALIVIGRVSNNGEQALQVLLSDRFYTYGAFLLVILYLMLVVDMKNKTFVKPIYGIVPVCFFGILSFSNAQNRLFDLKNRVQCDAINAFLFKKSANYILNTHESYLLSNADIYNFPTEINEMTLGKINQSKIWGSQNLILEKQVQLDPQIGQYKILNVHDSKEMSVENLVYLESANNPMSGILIPIVQINQGRDNIIKVHTNGFDYSKPFNAYLIKLNLSL